MALAGPKKSPSDFKFKKGDSHIIVNDETETAKAYSHDGKLLWKIPALAKGVNGPDWRYNSADTPPGLYYLGAMYDDRAIIMDGGHVPDRIRLAYGWITFDMVDLENQETGIGRAGICMHGGGSVHGWKAWRPRQPYLAYTHGCVRMHNEDLYEKVLPLYRQGKVYVSVFQDV